MSCSEQETKKYCCARRSRLPDLGLVVGIEHLGDGLRDDLLVHRPVVVAGVEGLEVERLDRLGPPQPQHVAGVDAVALDRRVVGDALHHALRHPADPELALFVLVVLGVAAPVDVIGDIGLGDLPGVAVAQPLVGDLRLPAVADLLVEDAELVADAVADGRALQRRQRVEIAGGQPAQAAVAQPRLLLAGQDLIEVLARARPAPCALLLRCRG